MNKQKVFENLGIRLRRFREEAGVGIKEAARVVDVDYSYLSKIEKGQEKPSKRLLNKLVCYYDISSIDQANELFSLAGYMRIDGEGVKKVTTKNSKGQSNRPLTVSMPVDMPILYSDAIRVDANKFGFVLNFTQQLGPHSKRVVSRIGMSKEHARSLVGILEGLLLKTSGKRTTRKVVLN